MSKIMRTLIQEALRLTDKVISNLRCACAIAEGREKGSVHKLERKVAISHVWCKELLDMILHIEYQEKKEEGDEILKNSKEQIGELYDVLSTTCKCLRGEIANSLHETQTDISCCEKMANLLKQSIMASQSK